MTKDEKAELEKITNKLESKIDKLVENAQQTIVSVELLKQETRVLTREVREMKETERSLTKSLNQIEAHVERIEDIGGGKDLKNIREAVKLAQSSKKFFVVAAIAIIGSIAKLVVDLFFVG